MVALTVLGISFFFLNVYTKHGDEVVVPDFEGIYIKDLDKFIEDHNVRYEIVDSIYKETLQAALKGGRGYRWTNPGMEFDRGIGEDIKYNLKVLFPDSGVEYIQRKSEFEIYWN